jgi:hypothetical protein
MMNYKKKKIQNGAIVPCPTTEQLKEKRIGGTAYQT